jgi:DNA polymerase III delta prime subunit
VRNWVGDRFTRQAKWNAFVGWQTYYQAFLQNSPGRALVDHQGPYVGGDLRQVEVVKAMASGTRVFLVSGPPGCGKSRFALELARLLGRDQRSWDVRFVRCDDSAVQAELHEITKLKRVVLIVDDAQESPQWVQLLAGAARAADAQSPIHLVCLTRPSGRAEVMGALANHFPVGVPQEIDLGRPNPKLVRELIDKRIPNVSPHHRDVIRRFVGDSFFATVLMCSSVARQKTLPQTLSSKHVRDYVLHQPIVRAVQALCTPEKALRALAVYTACAPTRLGDSSIRECAVLHSGLSLSDLEVLEQRALQGGLFQMYGRGLLRPVPDILGDLILEETCLDEHGRLTPFGQTLMSQLFEHSPAQVMRNCANISRLFSTAKSVDVLSPLVLTRANSLQPADRHATLQLLQSCAPLAARQPTTIVRLLEMLEARNVLRKAPPAAELNNTDNLEVYAQSLLLTASEYDTTLVPRALDYSRQLLAAARPDPRSYETVHKVVSSFCSYAVGRPYGHTKAVLDVFQTWLADSDAEKTQLIASLVQGYLPIEAHGFRRDDNALVPFLASVVPSDELWQLRARSLVLLVRCSEHENPAVQYLAAMAVQRWAHGYGNLTPELRERWAPQLQRELALLAETFSKLGATTSHLPVRAAVEHQGWRWWVNGADSFVMRGGQQILTGLPQGNTYSLWKALHDGALPVVTVVRPEDSTDEQRRDHFLALTNPTVENIEARARTLFDALDPACGDFAAWADLYTTVLRALPKTPMQSQAHPHLAEFVARHPDEAWSFVTEAAAESPLGAILPGLMSALRARDPLRWEAQIRNSSPGTRLFDAALRALWGASQLDPAERAMVTQALQLDDEAAVHLSAETLLNVSVSAIGPGLTEVFAAIRTRPADVRLWELAIDAFDRWSDHVLSAPPDEEPSPELRTMASEFLVLFRRSGTALSWDHGLHTRGLTTALAVFAVVVPHTLKAWMREVWSRGQATSNDIALSTLRLPEVVRLIEKSSVVSYWQKQFVEWVVEEGGLASMLAALSESVQIHRRSPQFANDTLAAIDSWVARDACPPMLRETLSRARQAIQAAVEEQRPRDEQRE